MPELTPEEQKWHDEHGTQLMSEEARATFDNMTADELRYALETSKMTLKHEGGKYEDIEARLKYRIGYIRGKLKAIYE